MHFFSLTLFLVAVPMFFISWNFWWVAAAVVSAPIGTAGHYFFRDGGVRVRDFTAPRTVYSLIIIYGMIALGKYGAEIARVKKIVDAHEPQEKGSDS
ncbi:MAG: hypothetical protein JNL01_00265 [Bdellovibrionales bacterium]|nr:hypothetical protein [Bdellovibrionales bacterium]